MSLESRNIWGIGSSDVTKYGERDSHRAKTMKAKAGKFQHDAELRELAESAGIGVKRVQRELHAYRKAGILPSWV